MVADKLQKQTGTFLNTEMLLVLKIFLSGSQ